MLFIYSAQIRLVLQRGLSFKLSSGLGFLLELRAPKYSSEVRANHVPNCLHLRIQFSG